MNEYIDVFVQEMKEHLEILNASIMHLEKDPQNASVIHEIFRMAHSMKGMAGAMEFDRMSNLTHGMEDVLQDIRDGKMQVNRKILDLLFISHDYLENALNTISKTGQEPEAAIDHILSKLHTLVEDRFTSLAPAKAEEKPAPTPKRPGAEITYRISVILDKDCQFKNVRAYIIYHALEEIGQILRSDPDKDNLQGGTPDFESRVVMIVFQSKKHLATIQKRLKNITEVVDVVVEETDPDKLDISAPVQLVSSVSSHEDQEEQEVQSILDDLIEGTPQERIAVDTEFLDDFIIETKTSIMHIELALLELETQTHQKTILDDIFRGFHTIKGFASFINMDWAVKIAAKAETVIDDYRKQEIKVPTHGVDWLIGAVDKLKALIESPSHFPEGEDPHQWENFLQFDVAQALEMGPTKRLGDILVEGGLIDEDQIESLAEKQRTEYPHMKLGQVIVKEHALQPKDVVGALRQQTEPLKTPSAAPTTVETNVMRIATSKVDNLVDMVGELIIIQAQVEQNLQDVQAPEEQQSFSSHLGRMSRIIKNLQNLSMSMRMVSLKSLFTKINRIARDTMRELDKEIHFQMEGEDTEIDRSVVDKLLDPMVHLVRNAIGHGIEDAQTRQQAGKNEKGDVMVRAYSHRGNVFIEVSDDGKGLDVQKIARKGIERKLIDEGREYSDEEIVNLIFLPGFSTMDQVNQISGRGVGLDVVKTDVSKVGGKLEVKNRPGEGSLFRLSIPINLAVIDGTVLLMNHSSFIVPTVNVKQIIQPSEKNWVDVKGSRSMIRLREQIIPIIPIGSIFQAMGQKELTEESGLLVILEHDGKTKALPVEGIVGRREIVVKPLGSEFQHLSFLSGASILGDGRVALIIDVENLFKKGAGNEGR